MKVAQISKAGGDFELLDDTVCFDDVPCRVDFVAGNENTRAGLRQHRENGFVDRRFVDSLESPFIGFRICGLS